MARLGHKRAPTMYHGGVVHPPKPRDFSISLNKKVRKFAMRSALAAKYKEGKLAILDSVTIDKPKNKSYC